MNVGDVNYYTHSSKTKCVFVDNKELPLISIDIWCKAGSSFEDVDKNGTAHLLEHMIFKGNEKIMPGEFDFKIESLGGLSNASTGYDDVHYHILVPNRNFRESLGLLTNLVMAPMFNLDEFKKEKGVVIDEIKQQNDQPEEKLFNYFLKRVWQNNNYAKPILGDEESIKSLEITDLEKFHNENYLSEKISFAIAGNLNQEIYQTFEDSDLSGLREKNPRIETIFSNSERNGHYSMVNFNREEIEFKDIEFSRIFMAWNIPSLKNQKIIIGLEILGSILSTGRNSRLVRALKEKNLVESVYSDVNAGEFGGIFLIEANCEFKDLKIVENTINKIIDGISEYKNISPEEIKKAINLVRSNYYFNLETSSQLSSFYGNELLWGRKSPISKIESYLKYWEDLTNFQEITNFFNSNKFTLIASPG